MFCACNAGGSGLKGSPGGGHGNPLQYSFLENPMDRGALRATVHRVPESRNDWATNTFTFTLRATGYWPVTCNGVLCLEKGADSPKELQGVDNEPIMEATGSESLTWEGRALQRGVQRCCGLASVVMVYLRHWRYSGRGRWDQEN